MSDISAAIGLIHDAGVDAECWPAALGRVRALLGAMCINIVYRRIPSGAPVLFESGYDPRAVDAYLTTQHRLDPVRPALLQAPVGAITTARCVSSRADAAKLPFHAEFLRPFEMEDVLQSYAFRDAEFGGLLTAVRARRSDDFGADDVRLAELLMPHFRRAMRISLELGGRALRSLQLGAALHGMAQAIIVSDASARIIFANAAAELLLARPDGLRSVNAALGASSHAATAALRRLIHDAAGDDGPRLGHGGVLRVRRPSGKRDLLVLVTPLAHEAMPSGDAGRCALIMICDPEAKSPDTADILREAFGLTRAEAGVAARLADGADISAVARILGVTLATAKSHLQRVFAKTDTHRQPDLVRLLQRIASARTGGADAAS